jgi:hypothetical protein
MNIFFCPKIGLNNVCFLATEVWCRPEGTISIKKMNAIYRLFIWLKQMKVILVKMYAHKRHWFILGPKNECFPKCIQPFCIRLQ